MGAQRQDLYFRTSKASKLSTRRELERPHARQLEEALLERTCSAASVFVRMCQ